MCVCAGIAHAVASGVRRGGAEGQTQGVQAARGVRVREAAHVRLGATMASELAEKRSAIAWMGWVDHGRVVKGHFADTDVETSADFHLENERHLSRFQRDFIERRALREDLERAAFVDAHAARRRSRPTSQSFGMPCAATGWADDIMDAFFACPSDS